MATKKKVTSPCKITGKVFGGALNIRLEPSTDAAVLGQLEDGEEIEILETLTGWYRFKDGYVMSKWVEFYGRTN